MNLFKKILSIALLTFSFVGCAHAKKDEAPKKDKNESVWVVTQYYVATNPGCWATFYNDENYKGESLTLSGNQELEDVELDLKPYRFGGSPDSIVVGPKAKLKLYGDEDFKDLKHYLKAHAHMPKLTHNPWWASIESVKLECLI